MSHSDQNPPGSTKAGDLIKSTPFLNPLPQTPMSYGTFHLVPNRGTSARIKSRTRRDHHVARPSKTCPSAVSLTEVVTCALASFFIIVPFLQVAGVEYGLLSPLKVTFGFTCLVFAFIDGATFCWHCFRRSSGGQLRRLEDVEAGIPLPSEGDK